MCIKTDLVLQYVIELNIFGKWTILPIDFDLQIARIIFYYSVPERPTYHTLSRFHSSAFSDISLFPRFRQIVRVRFPTWLFIWLKKCKKIKLQLHTRVLFGHCVNFFAGKLMSHIHIFKRLKHSSRHKKRLEQVYRNDSNRRKVIRNFSPDQTLANRETRIVQFIVDLFSPLAKKCLL